MLATCQENDVKFSKRILCLLQVLHTENVQFLPAFSQRSDYIPQAKRRGPRGLHTTPH